MRRRADVCWHKMLPVTNPGGFALAANTAAPRSVHAQARAHSWLPHHALAVLWCRVAGARRCCDVARTSVGAKCSRLLIRAVSHWQLTPPCRAACTHKRALTRGCIMTADQHAQRVDQALRKAFSEACRDQDAASAVFSSKVMGAKITVKVQDLFTHIVWLCLQEGSTHFSQCVF